MANTEYSEALNDRPRDEPWTEAELARFAKSRMATVALANARAAKKAGTHVLIDALWLVEFHPKGNVVKILTTDRRACRRESSSRSRKRGKPTVTSSKPASSRCETARATSQRAAA